MNFNHVIMSLSKYQWIKNQKLDSMACHGMALEWIKTLENFKIKIQLKKGKKDEKMADELYEARKVIEEYRKMLDQYS